MNTTAVITIVTYRCLQTGPHNETYGVHGFDNDMPDMHPFMIGHGPRFKPGFLLPDPAPGTAQEMMMNLDLYPMICDILGVAAPPNNGTLARASALLRAAPPRPNGDSAEWLLRKCHIFQQINLL
jgi:hypothetical protein